MWNKGNSHINIAVQNLMEPNPDWGARQKDEQHVKVFF